MTGNSGSSANRRRKPSRASGSSSTINAVKGMQLQCFRVRRGGRNTIGQRHSGHGAARLGIFQRERGGLSVKLAKALPRVGQADSVLARAAGGKAGAVIVHVNPDD